MRILLVHSDDRPFEVERFDAAWWRAGGRAGELVPVTPRTAAAALGTETEFDGLLLTGGPDVEPARYGREPEPGASLNVDRTRDALDLELLARADVRRLPVLAVCYGCQLLAVSRGGALVQDLELAGKSGHRILEPKDHLAHPVTRTPESRLLRPLPREFSVNTRHHQAVQHPGNGMRVAAVSPDGIIEAIEGVDEDRFVLGIQWHPEHIAGGVHDEVFRMFRTACLDFARRQRAAARDRR